MILFHIAIAYTCAVIVSIILGWTMESLKQAGPSIVFTLGLAAMSAGCACYDPPLGLIVPGAVLCGFTAILHVVGIFVAVKLRGDH